MVDSIPTVERRDGRYLLKVTDRPWGLIGSATAQEMADHLRLSKRTAYWNVDWRNDPRPADI